MKRLLVAFALVLSTLMGTLGFVGTPASAETGGCSFNPRVPYETAYNTNLSYGSIYCNTGTAHQFRICILQNGVAKSCVYSPVTYNYNWSGTVTCTRSGLAGPSPFTTLLTVYTSLGAFYSSAQSGASYLHLC